MTYRGVPLVAIVMYLYYDYEMVHVDGLPAFGMVREIFSRFKVQN